MSGECYSVSRGNEFTLTGKRRGDRMPKNLKLKAARAEKDMTQGALAEAAGVSRQTINAIEKGEYNPTINLCRSICKILGKTLDELLTTCKRFGVDYYNASEKDRAFVEAVARKNYGIKQAKMNGVSVSTVEPFFGIHRAV